MAITTSMLAMTAIVVSVVSAVASTAIGITSSVIQSNQMKAQANYQRKVNEMNAKASRDAAQAKVENQRRATKFTHGTQLAKLGGMGALAEGSPLDIMGQTASQSKYDQLVTEYQGEAQMVQFQQKAALNDYEAKMADYNMGLNISAQVAKGAGQIGSSLLVGSSALGSSGAPTSGSAISAGGGNPGAGSGPGYSGTLPTLK